MIQYILVFLIKFVYIPENIFLSMDLILNKFDVVAKQHPAQSIDLDQPMSVYLKDRGSESSSSDMTQTMTEI